MYAVVHYFTTDELLQMSVVKPMYVSVMLSAILEKIPQFKEKKIYWDTVILLIKKQTN